ncbi:MAG TPA: hypothetical protein VGN34_31310 [Ktedonobacteraceae bacterium]
MFRGLRAVFLLGTLCLSFSYYEISLAKVLQTPVFLPFFHIPKAIFPTTLFQGPGTDMWFLPDGKPGKIERITTEGKIREYTFWPDPAAFDVSLFDYEYTITADPAGSVWFYAYPDNIGHMTPDGKVTSFHIPMSTLNGRIEPLGVLFYDPRGRLWYISAYGSHWGYITVTGKKYTEPSKIACSVHCLTIGYDGDLWFITGDSINHLMTNGVIVRYPLSLTGYVSAHEQSPAPSAFLQRGPQHALWFWDSHTNQIGMIDKNNRINEYPHSVTYLSYGINSLAAGSDGNLWMDDFSTSSILRMTPYGMYTQYPLPDGETAYNLIMGRDGNLWFTTSTLTIGRIHIANPAALI